MGSQRRIRLKVFVVGEVGQIREVQIEVFGDVEPLDELVRLGTRPPWPGRYPDRPDGCLRPSWPCWTRRLRFVVAPKRSIDRNLRRRSRNGNDKRRRAKQYHLCTCCSAWPGKPRRDILEDFQWSLQCRIRYRWDLPWYLHSYRVGELHSCNVMQHLFLNVPWFSIIA